jgi:hypothetical protein
MKKVIVDQCFECFHEWPRKYENRSKRCPCCGVSFDRKSKRFNLQSVPVGGKKFLKHSKKGSWSVKQSVDRFERKTGRFFIRKPTIEGILIERVE